MIGRILKNTFVQNVLNTVFAHFRDNGRCVGTLAILVMMVHAGAEKVYAQSGQCDAGTPFFFVDLRNNPDSTYVSPFFVRQGTCCGNANPDRCLEFEVMLDSSATGLVFGIDSGAIPPGALDYQINCGPLTTVGTPICLNGVGPHFITFCKPGGNSNSYYISSYPIRPSAPSPMLRENCQISIQVEELNPDSLITWHDVTAGSGGAYEAYFSCTSGCNTMTISSPPSPPAFIDYAVCGWVRDTICNLPYYICDTARVTIVTPVLNAVLTNPVCNNYNNGSIDLTVANIDPPYAVAWSNGDTSEDISGLTAGTYIATVFHSGPCTISDTFQLTGPQPIQIDTQITHVNCTGILSGAIDVTVYGGAPPFQYLWSTGDTTQDLDSVAAGVYSITVTDDDSCSFAMTGIIVLDDSLFIDSIASSSVTCNGLSDGTIDVLVAGGTQPYAFTWSSGQSTGGISGLAPGTYTVTVSDAIGCADTSSAIAITQPPVLAASIDTLSEIRCPFDSNGAFYVTYTGGVGNYSLLWSDGQTSDTAIGLTFGSYTVTVSDSNGCQVQDTASLADALPIFTFSTVSSDLTCYRSGDGWALADTSGNDVPLTLLWSTGHDSDTIQGLSYGMYSVTVTDTLGCVQADTVFVNQPDSIFGAGITSNVSCNGFDDGRLQVVPVGGTGPYALTWSNGMSGNQLQNLSPGIYVATITDNNACYWSDSFAITEPLPLDPVMTGTDPTCYNASNGMVTTLVNGGTPPYTWYWSNGQSSSQISDLAAGSYAVTITDANACRAFLQLVLNSPDTPTAQISSSGTELTMGESTQLEVFSDLPMGNLHYSWTPPTGLSCDDCANPVASPYTSVQYEVTVTDRSDPGHPCPARDFIVIDVTGSFNVYIPNAFTPNNDELNDVFRIYGEGIAGVQLRIFNKIGTKVFDSLQSDTGWNGMYKGQVQSPGVYAYMASVTFIDGSTRKFQGSVTLIR